MDRIIIVSSIESVLQLGKKHERLSLPFEEPLIAISLPLHAYLQDATSESYNKDPPLLLTVIPFTVTRYPFHCN
jgi:hypothetical protein